jgi:nucleoside-diphosphate-sugar epimerase
MSPRIFITGVSGFIGGHFLNNLASTHPDYDIVGLVRTEDQAKIVAEKLPSVKIVIGDLDHTSLLIEESKKADVVIRTYLNYSHVFLMH